MYDDLIMAIQQQVYANTDPIYFKLTKNGVGVTGQAPFSAGDIFACVDGGAGTDISANVTETTFGYGWYVWTPTAGQTTGLVIIINIAEAVGTNFDENGMSIVTGGNSSARMSG